MSAATDYLETNVLAHVLAQSAYAMPSAVYLGRHTASPTDTGSLAAEVSTSGTGYARADITSKMGTPHATLGRSTNSAVITIGPALSDWGTLTHLSINDAVTSTNMLLWGQASTARTITTGESDQFLTGQLAIQFA